MLSLGPGSSCDVCFERFGLDSKAPCSIECGHVFCSECINQIPFPVLCPMCRTPFDVKSCIKLHVDVDAVGSEAPLPSSSQCSPADLKEAHRFQQAISNIADSGISETDLRQLIQDCRAFLQTQHRSLHKDLRSSSRMVTYLCEVKTSMRTYKLQSERLTELIAQGNQEKANIRKQLQELDELRKYEKETSQAVETTLRQHCDQAVNCYKSSIELCNKVSKQNQSLKRQLELVTLAWTGRGGDEKGANGAGLTPPTTDLEFDQSDLEGVAIQDPNHSFLISPLPQFTGALPSMFDNFTPMPELAEDEEGEQESSEEDEEVSTPDTLPEQLLRQPKESRRVSMPELIPVPSQDHGRKFLQEPSGLSRTAPYLQHRRARSSSSPSSPTRRSHSPCDRGRASPSSPPPAASRNSSSAQPSSSRDTSAPNVRRLYEILGDSSPSISLPNVSSGHFPPTLTHRDSLGRMGRNSSPPSRTGSSNSSRTPVPSGDGVSLISASLQAHNVDVSPPSTSPHGHRTGMSSASAEAKKLEEERRARRAKEKQQLSLEYDRANLDFADRDDRRSGVSGTSSASQAARRDPQPYSNPLNASNGTPTASSSSSRWGSTTGGNYWPGPGLPSQDQGSGQQQQHSRYSGSRSAKPTTLPANPPGVYT